MKKIISLAVCFVMPFVLMGAKTAEDTPPTTSAQAFVLYCPDNNTVICSKNADEMINLVPNDRILIETDSPYLAPEPVRGTRNTPINVKYVAQKIADAKGMTLEEIADITYENARKIFKI